MIEVQPTSILVAFAAGLVSFISPCVLPLVPAFLGHLAGASLGGEVARGRVFTHALAFVVGFSLVLTGIWVAIGLLGYFVRDYYDPLRQAGGALLVVLGLHALGIVHIPWLYEERRFHLVRKGPPSLPTSFLVGMVFAAGWTPCIGQILAGIIGLATLADTAWQGAYLLLAYSAGLGVPFLLAALALGRAAAAIKRLNRYSWAVSGVSGIFLIGVCLLMLTNQFVVINRYFQWGAL